MEDPVVSEAGFTYERKALEEHYKLKGPIEPINRKQCKGYIITNQALKITIEEFLNEHPWGFETHDK
jgi:U-box domain